MHNIPVFFVPNPYTIIILCRSGLIGNRMPGREIARRGTFALLPCASAYCQKNFKKTMKNREKGLDIPLNIRYDNQVRVVEAFPRADTAMNREIALQGGNFRGVCPIIGRLRSPVCGVDRHTMGQVPATVPVFFMSRNDTHG